MTDHAYRERVTLLLVNDALEANQRDMEEATIQLLDAAGTLIVHAMRDGTAMVIAQRAADYLLGQVARHQKGPDHG